MKFFAYQQGTDKLLSLGEVSIQASSSELKILSSFLAKCATEIDTDLEWEHEHLQDNFDLDLDQPDLIVVRD